MAERLDLNLLPALEALLDERSVTRAAERLGISQSAMSHALNRLRTFFNDPLFVRCGIGMIPTPKAESLQEAVAEAMAVVRGHIETEVLFEPRSARREFVLCITDIGELVFMPGLLERLLREAPRSTLRTVQAPLKEIGRLLESGEVDLALGSYRLVSEELYKQRLFMHTFTTIVHVDHPCKTARMSLDEFENSQHIAVTLSGQGDVSHDRIIEDQGIKRNIVLRTPHFLVIPLLLEQNRDLIATVPLEVGRVFERLGTIRTVKPPIDLPCFAINQYWHPLKHHDPTNKWLRNLIKETFDKYPDIYTGPILAYSS